VRKKDDAMTDLLEEMRGCKTVRACIDLALTDAYGEDEQAVAWLTCIETMFGRFKHVRVLGTDVMLVRFDLRHLHEYRVHHQGLQAVGDPQRAGSRGKLLDKGLRNFFLNKYPVDADTDLAGM